MRQSPFKNMIIIFVFFCLGHTSEKRESHFTFQSDITSLFTKRTDSRTVFFTAIAYRRFCLLILLGNFFEYLKNIILLSSRDVILKLQQSYLRNIWKTFKHMIIVPVILCFGSIISFTNLEHS